MKDFDRRKFLQFAGTGAMAGAFTAGTFDAQIAKALAIPANRRTGTIEDVEHIIVLMQENRPFDHHFGTLRGVRGFNDPRAVKIHLPLASGVGTTPASVFLQPAGPAYTAAGYSFPPNYGTLGGPADGAPVFPPFRVNPQSVSPGGTSLGGVAFGGTDHSWSAVHACWNQGQYDNFVIQQGPMAMTYMTRADMPLLYALADAFTVGDAYHCSIMGPTSPNRHYLMTGCVGNVNYLGVGGTDGRGAGPVTGNGLSPQNAYYVWETFPEVLQAAGVSWKVYQDLAGATFKPDFGNGSNNIFAGNYTDNPLLYYNQYATAPTSSPLFQRAATGTDIMKLIPASSAPAKDWANWAEHLFDQFRADVQDDKLPQVSWIVAPAAYSGEAYYLEDHAAWYVGQIFDILVSNPAVFAKTVFIICFDEADGSFDHMVPPTPPQSATYGQSTVNIKNEILTTSDPAGPVGLGTRVPFLAISPWSKGGYVNSQVFDHTSIIQFIEKRFGVHERNLSPWRRAVVGDLTSVFNFATPDDGPVERHNVAKYLPTVAEFSTGKVPEFQPTLDTVLIGIPAQENGIRRARPLPYKLDVDCLVYAAHATVVLEFHNIGAAAAVFQVRSGNPADAVRSYTVEAGRSLLGEWSVSGGTYDLTVYGPNGFTRYFKGSLGVDKGQLAVDVEEGYDTRRGSFIGLQVRNLSRRGATVNILDAYTGTSMNRQLAANALLQHEWSLDAFHSWYDLILTVAQDATFEQRLAGHVETGQDSFSDPAMGGLVQLKA
ncbi:MAG TPA: phospholipase C, phosphocholine-specific [Bradyrhizobium sp.]|nr:phospholipase C, phosphocholine-specific [Bradyrhizobium sp.]